MGGKRDNHLISLIPLSMVIINNLLKFSYLIRSENAIALKAEISRLKTESTMSNWINARETA